MVRVGILRERDRVELIAGENPIILNNQSEPQPDVVLLRSRSDYYATGHPQPDEFFCLSKLPRAALSPIALLKYLYMLMNFTVAEIVGNQSQ